MGIKQSGFWVIALCVSFLAPKVKGAENLGVSGSAVSVPVLFPEGCGSPYMDLAAFSTFFESALGQMAAAKGPNGKGVVDLFAVWELRRMINERLSDPTVESPVDRLLMSQLCQFQKIEMKNKIGMGLKESAFQVDSASETLHTHLSLISGKLFKETRELAVSFLTERAKRLQKESLANRKAEDIRKARELGRNKVRDLVDQETF
jgi:hypothetical protein